MTTVGAELDRIQGHLHDGGTLWSRAELARVWNDRYRELCATTQAARRWRALDLPGRHTYTITTEWEDRHTTGAVRKPTRRGAYRDATALWEPQHLAEVPPEARPAGWTQDWERAFVTDPSDRPMTVTFPRPHERIVRLHWNDRPLAPVGMRELDALTTAWWEQTGEARWWTLGTGRVRSVELYALPSADVQGWVCVPSGPPGLPRAITSDAGRGYAVSITPEPVLNAWAYTGSADAQALSVPPGHFAPSWAVTHEWEVATVSRTEPRVVSAWVFALELPSMTVTVVHPWELGLVGGGGHSVTDDPAVPGQRGMFPWERHADAGDYQAQVPTPDHPPSRPGLGVRITILETAATGRGGVQPWETAWLNGTTPLPAGQTRATYVWESLAFAATFGTLGLGTLRRVISPDRQYLAVSPDPHGTLAETGRAADWRASTEALFVLEVVVPDTPLAESDTPMLLPAPLLKYVRYGVLGYAFGRPGQGASAILADHYRRRFARGLALFRRLGDVAHRDQTYQREPIAAGLPDRTPRVRLPAQFPAVW